MAETELITCVGSPFVYRLYTFRDEHWWNITTPEGGEPLCEYSGEEIAQRLNDQHAELAALRAEVERLQVHEAFHAVAVQQRNEAWGRIDCLISKFRQEVERLREAVLAAYRKGHHHTVNGGYQWCDQGGREVVEEIIREAAEEE